MKLLLKWVGRNKGWLFSGIGVVILGSIVKHHSFLCNHLTSRIPIPYFLLYILIAFFGFSLALMILRLKRALLPEQDATNQHMQVAYMLECELKPISRNVKTLVASILELPDILDFLRGNKFCRLCERHDFNKEWQLIKKLVNRRSLSYHIEDTLYNFINTLYLMGNDFLQEFFEDFQKRYKEEHPSADFTQIESELKNLDKVSQPKHREEVREEYNQMLTERKLFEQKEI
jgi:hypothetical protein